MSSWFFNEKNKPQYVAIPIEDDIVQLYEIDNKYQCPIYCEGDHFHYVYYDSTVVEDGQMYINKDKLGERYKEGV